jgi:hypothetical protein
MPREKKIRSSELRPNPVNGIVVTSLDAAKRHIETAINLWFEDGDPVSIYTLTCAARDLVLPIAKKEGAPLATYDEQLLSDLIVPGKRKEWDQGMRVHQNFFKHGTSDRNASIKFDPAVVALELRVTLLIYAGLNGVVRTPLMMGFCWFFYYRNPTVMIQPPETSVVARFEAAMATGSKREFRDEFLKLPIPADGISMTSSGVTG